MMFENYKGKEELFRISRTIEYIEWVCVWLPERTIVKLEDWKERNGRKIIMFENWEKERII